MKNILTISILIIGSLLFSSCEEETSLTLSEGLQISVGRQCGWCYGEQELAITSEVSSYYYDYGCGDSLDVPEKFFETPEEDWVAINDYLKKGNFQSLELNSCSVCADGCDYIIKVSDIAFEHEIRFVNTEIIEDESIREMANQLIDQLNELYNQK